VKRIFVYGLLRPGFEGAGLLGDAQPLGAATTSGLLYDLGGYPGLVPGDGVVHGEICAVDDTRLPALDAFEDYNPVDPVGSLYIRTTVMAWLVASGEAITVQVYRYNRPVPEHAWIADGDYARYAAGRG
jgi:gamma-glutamylcyclotransferase (GGCT)/AIG2-like uncharacterized protein YtfP